jgi:ABC-type nickel/cobalt efflux system permease component RcnA
MSCRRLVLLSILGLLLTPSVGRAHPMGNFSVSHYSSLRVGAETIELRHVLDMAEIPAFQEIQETGIVPEVDHPTVSAYLARKAETLKEGLRLDVDGTRLELRLLSSEALFPPGAGGLPTMKLGFLYRAAGEVHATDGIHQVSFRDDNLPGRAGWKEIIAVKGPGVTFAQSSVPEMDRSAELSNYPTDLSGSPPQDLEARVFFRRLPLPGLAMPVPPVGVAPDEPRPEQRPSVDDTARARVETASLLAPSVEASRLKANENSTPRIGLTEMVTTREMGPTIILLAAIVAVGLGALHALEPGHGKTLVAAYLVGSRGTARHAMVLGLTVTLAHTAGVYLLGGLTLYASRYVLPERLYPWLTVTSGLIVAGLGVALFRQRYSARAHGHRHGHAHPHASGHIHEPGYDDEHDLAHGDSHSGGHPHDHHVDQHSSRVRLRELIALGVSGGIVPCPAALVVLLSALSMRRAGFGLFLIVAFSIGLAATLIVIGLSIVYARRLMTRFEDDGPLIRRWLPLTSAAGVTVLGLAIAVQALRTGVPWPWL